MTDEKSQSDGAQGKLGPAQFTLQDVLIVFVWIGTGCGLVAQIAGGEPSELAMGTLFVVWIALGCWLLWAGTRRHSCLLQLLGGSSFILCGLCLAPAISPPRSAARRVQCFQNLRNIAVALHQYHATYGCFPPAYVADERGRPMHSWRVLLLPFIEQEELTE